jgi:hypothetical protein
MGRITGICACIALALWGCKGSKGAETKAERSSVLLYDSGGIDLVADADSLYLSTGHSHRLARIDKATGEATELLSGDGNTPMALAVDGDMVYWIDEHANELRRIPKAGGKVETVSTGEGSALVITGGEAVMAIDDSVVAINLKSDGFGTMRTIAQMPACCIVEIATDGTSLFFSDDGDERVFRVSVAGGDQKQLAGPQNGAITDIEVYGDDVYWTVHKTWDQSDSTGKVMRVAKTGGEPTLVADKQTLPASLVAGPDGVAWTNQRATDGSDGTIARAPLAGGNVETLSIKEPSPNPIVADAERYYFLTMGEVRTLPRK